VLQVGEPVTAEQLLPPGEDPLKWRLINLIYTGDSVGFLLVKLPEPANQSTLIEVKPISLEVWGRVPLEWFRPTPL
jgi:hypothetical protein